MTGFARHLLVLLARLLVGARGEWLGCAPQPGRRIYFANHSSHFDTLAVIAAMPLPLRRTLRPVAARDYWGRTRLGRFFAEGCLRAVLLDRTPRFHEDPLAPVAAVLERGESILIFPEGTRGDGEAVAGFKPGLFHIARRFPEVDLVPVHLDNLARVMPKGSPLVVPLTCTARFGAPFRLDPGEPKQTFLARARGALLALAPAAAEPER